MAKVDDGGGEEDCSAADNFTEGDTFATNDGWKDLPGVLEAYEEGSIDGHPSSESHDEAREGESGGDESVGKAAHSSGDEKGEKSPATPELGDDEGDRPAGDFTQSPQEVTHVEAALAHVGCVLDYSVVTQETGETAQNRNEDKF